MSPAGLHGILVLNKPAGPTSHDCVARVRRVLGVRRVGHAGTLDPMASGVLLIGIGYGTRILEYLQGLPKVYRARLRLGLETDTQDVTGTVLVERDAGGVDREQFQAALEGFRGEILQVPPMYSAVRVGGRRLYELARRGEEAARQARPVTIYRLECLGFRPGPLAEGEILVHCSAGTYVRTLAHDLGRELSTGAALSALTREAIGETTLKSALRPDEVGPGTPLIPLAEALAHLPAVEVDEEAARRLACGQYVPTPDETPDGPVRVLAPDGLLQAIAVVRGHGSNRLLTPEKVFPSEYADGSGS